jgi:site-specific DNA-methyltransferase (adenine-specific)
MKRIEPFTATALYKLYVGDCIETLNGLPEESVDLIFADPPYNLSNGGTSVHAGKRVSVDKGDWDKSSGPKEDFEFHLAWIDACRRVLKKDGTIWISGTYHSIFACGYALQLLDYRILNDVAWFKPNAAPNLGCRMFTASHETLIWASKSKKSRHTFNYKEMREGDFPSDFLKKPGKQMRSVWSVTTPAKSEKVFGKHPTQKPLELVRRTIIASTNEGDVVLDPFMGSGTTAVAAKIEGRKFTGSSFSEEIKNLGHKWPWKIGEG